MVTITYDALNEFVHNVAYEIEKATGLNKDTMLDLYALNDALVAYLNRYGVQYEDQDDSQDPEKVKQEAVANIRMAVQVIAPIWEDMHKFGHSQADDIAGAQANLEQAVRFLTGEEEPE